MNAERARDLAAKRIVVVDHRNSRRNRRRRRRRAKRAIFRVTFQIWSASRDGYFVEHVRFRYPKRIAGVHRAIRHVLVCRGFDVHWVQTWPGDDTAKVVSAEMLVSWGNA